MKINVKTDEPEKKRGLKPSNRKNRESPVGSKEPKPKKESPEPTEEVELTEEKVKAPKKVKSPKKVKPEVMEIQYEDADALPIVVFTAVGVVLFGAVGYLVGLFVF